MPSVIVVQNFAVEGLGRIAPMLSTAGVDVRLLGPEAPVPDDAAADGIIVLGGPMGVYDTDRHPRLREEERLLSYGLARGLPVLGICLGSQLLAHALGAPVRPAKAKEIGWHDVHLAAEADADPLFSGLPRTFRALHWHGDVFELPAGARPLARSEATPHQAFSYGANAWGVLFHLEADAVQIEAMARALPDDVRAGATTAEALVAESRRTEATSARLAATVFERWIRRVGAR
jgi:GMP synthase (glutamine-hydrolysing)